MIHTWQAVIEYLLDTNRPQKAFDYACAMRGPDICNSNNKRELQRRSIAKSMLTSLIRGGDSYWGEDLHLSNRELRKALEGMDSHFITHIVGGLSSLSFFYREAWSDERISTILYYLAESLSEKRFYNVVYYCRKLCRIFHR